MFWKDMLVYNGETFQKLSSFSLEKRFHKAPWNHVGLSFRWGITSESESGFRQAGVQEPLRSELNSHCLQIKRIWLDALEFERSKEQYTELFVVDPHREKRDSSSRSAESQQVSVYDSYLCFCCSVPETLFSLLSSFQLKLQLSSPVIFHDHLR